MSRVARAPVKIPDGVEVSVDGREITVSGRNGKLGFSAHALVEVVREDGLLRFSPRGSDPRATALAGTTRAVVSNLVTGVSQGFERRLTIVGVGYRAQVQGNRLNLTLGFSHPLAYDLPEGVTAETPSPTEIVLRSADKQRLGQAAAEIRGFRPPEPYKGKGVRYADEHVVRKQAKKK